MDNFMNEPEEKEWTAADIVREYEQYQDKKSVAKIFCITVGEVNKILKDTQKVWKKGIKVYKGVMMSNNVIDLEWVIIYVVKLPDCVL